MFASRNNENAIYEQQQAAAAKPLNQGVKGLAPKTPANKPPKTPFGKGRNDENAALLFGKDGGAKEGKAERNAFVTPANPRTRAPLGNKTTNAKAFQTPAPLLAPDKPKDGDRPSSTKPTSPRLRRSKIKVHETAENVLAQDPEERDVEYMPPREVPKEEDYDDICPRDRDYSMLKGKNLTRGWLSEYLPKKEDNGDDDELSDFEEKYQKAVEREKKELAAKKRPLSSKGTNATGSKAAPATMRAQNAASALSSRPSKPLVRKFGASTTAAKARQPMTSSSTATKKPIFEKGNPRFTAAKAASNSTIGYSKGRVVSAHRRPLSDIHSQPEPKEEKTTLDQLLNLGSMEIADEDADLGLTSPNKGIDQLVEDDEPEVFQLEPPQEI
ncbi:hypothetical protein M409DRAFT_23089 [Zasmidium cellare ATCC 36951]|uniref:Uncharacterized protein n=1 Tax=Zasmidium cellare ATCC 36951 TaxID=1080233 RepID=A0A6A6CL47_ZASCE|nr:uncharacterized protein M409DRAFT_23089 [Zasmidium cellare ATCC 36951]KAF2166449.1 hypothetical protein M409DRAFT_23089 [Zasmidium cellare ATCC 36951]